MNDIFEFLDHKHRPRHPYHHPKWSGSQVVIKNVFLQNGYQHKAFVYVSRTNNSRYLKKSFKCPYQSYFVLKLPLFANSNQDMAQILTLQRSCPWKIKS